MAKNGYLTDAELTPIPGGELAKEAAAAWNAPGGPGDAGLMPTGPESSYRTYAGQVKQRNYWCGKGTCGNAAVPGTSSHGLGHCVDLKEEWMRRWIDEHGAAYGWKKVEAPTEWWHVNFVGGARIPTFRPMKKGSRGARVERMTRRLAFIHKRGGHAYLKRPFEQFTDEVEEAVRAFQKDQSLEVDGIVGSKTAARINGVFQQQFHKRGGEA